MSAPQGHVNVNSSLTTPYSLCGKDYDSSTVYHNCRSCCVPLASMPLNLKSTITPLVESLIGAQKLDCNYIFV